MPTTHNYKKFLEDFDPIKINKLAEHKNFDYSKLMEETKDLFRAEAFCRKHKKYSNINILNGYKPQKYLYRYVSYQHFVQYVSNSYLAFISPHLWQDPFEKRFLDTDYTRYKYTQPEIFCMCTTENGIENEDAAWRLYGNGGDKILKIKINVDKLLYVLNEYSLISGVSIFVGKMNYEFSRKDIEQLHTGENEFYHTQFFYEPFDDQNYLSLMCLKQNAYQYENEVRLFCCRPYSGLSRDFMINVPIELNNIIEEVVVGPIYPFSMKDPRSSYFKEYNDLDFKVYSNCLIDLLPTIPIIQSSINIIEQLEVV